MTPTLSMYVAGFAQFAPANHSEISHDVSYLGLCVLFTTPSEIEHPTQKILDSGSSHSLPESSTSVIFGFGPIAQDIRVGNRSTSKVGAATQLLKFLHPASKLKYQMLK